MRWKAIAGAVGALALSAAGTVPARAASPAWQDWSQWWDGAVKVHFQLPATWTSRKIAGGYEYEPPSHYFWLQVYWSNRSAGQAVEQILSTGGRGAHLKVDRAVSVNGLPGIQCRYHGSYYEGYIRAFTLPDGDSVVFWGDFDWYTHLGNPGVVWHRIMAPLMRPGGEQSLVGSPSAPAPTTQHTISGTTFQDGTPVLPVTVWGPGGKEIVWAELDTGNETVMSITSPAAAAIGLTQTGSANLCGVTGCAGAPTYTGLSVATPQGTLMAQNAPATTMSEFVGGGYYVELDIGPNDLSGFHLRVSRHHWTLTWETP